MYKSWELNHDDASLTPQQCQQTPCLPGQQFRAIDLLVFWVFWVFNMHSVTHWYTMSLKIRLIFWHQARSDCIYSCYAVNIIVRNTSCLLKNHFHIWLTHWPRVTQHEGNQIAAFTRRLTRIKAITYSITVVLYL